MNPNKQGNKRFQQQLPTQNSKAVNQREGGRIFVALDTETTGTEPDAGEIIEVAAVRFRLEADNQPRILERWQTMVKPSSPIPYKITNLTGIRQADVEHAPTFAQIRERLRNFIGDWPIVGHSIESDFAFLARQNFEVRNAPIDTYELATLLLPQTGNYSLVAVANSLEVNREGDAHRAMADTLMAMNVFAALVTKIAELPPEILREINRVAQELPDWPLRQLFKDAARHNKPEIQGNTAMGNLGMLLKQQMAEKAGGPAADSNELDFMFLLPQEKPAPLKPEPDTVAAMNNLPATTVQSEAINQAVNNAFEQSKHLFLEVPGSEASRANGLVLPAVRASLTSGQTVVIAVNSEAQRERLLNKVIPELQRRLADLQTPNEETNMSRRDRERRRRFQPLPFVATTVKNQNSYLCLRRWEIFRQIDGLTPDELKLLIKVLIWLPNTTTGDSAELRIMSQERLWSRINTQKPLCLAANCVFNQRGQCFYFRARDRAEGANVVVTDQALVLADSVGLAGTLPEFEQAIIDDAHHLEDEASRQFGAAIVPASLFDFLDWISRPVTWRPQGGRNGFVHSLARFYGPNTPQAAKLVLGELVQSIIAQVEICRTATGNLLRDLTNTLQQVNQETGQGDGRIRLDQKFRNGGHWAEIAGAWDIFKQEWENLYYLLRDLRDEMHGVELQLVKTAEMMLDLNYFVNQSNHLLNKMTAAFEGGENGQVYWLANHPRTQLVAIYSAPLHVGQGLERTFFAKKKSVALLSSTMTTDGEFNFVRNRLGLNKDETLEAKVAPERDYSSSVLLYLPNDMPEPSQQGYQKAVDQHLIEIAKASQGRSVALFSSNSALRLTYKAIQRPLEQANILVLALGLDGTRRSVLERFRNTPNSLLLSTLGHWEQGDLFQQDETDGNRLVHTLVFTKLPFDPPSDPVFAARTEGRIFNDPFTEYSLPRTILRFKQSFERLLAALPEKGAVVMLDARLTRKNYGPTFLNSLPTLKTHRDSLSNMSHEIEGWLQQNKSE